MNVGNVRLTIWFCMEAGALVGSPSRRILQIQIDTIYHALEVDLTINMKEKRRGRENNSTHNVDEIARESPRRSKPTPGGRGIFVII